MRAHIGRCIPLFVIIALVSFGVTFVIYVESISTMKHRSLSVANNQIGHITLPLQDNLHHQNGIMETVVLTRKNSPVSRPEQKREFISVRPQNTTPGDKIVRSSKVMRRANGLLVFGGPISCEALNPQILLFNRIFKTGSTSTHGILNRMAYLMNYTFYSATTEDWYETGNPYPYPGVVRTIAKRKLGHFPRLAFAGHFYFRRDFKLNNTHTYITQVRQPIKRFVSHYFYIHKSKNRPPKRIQELIQSGQINETIEECFAKQRQGCKNNVMTRFFCGTEEYCKTGSKKALQKAMNNIEIYYASVGLLEHFNLYLKILQKRLPHFINDVKILKRLKVTPRYNMSSVSRDTIKKITEANWADISLYEFIRTKFWKQVRECGLNSTQ